MGNPDRVISVTGLGYVGLPVAVEFARKFKTIGFDIDARRISELRQGVDRTREVASPDLRQSRLVLTTDPTLLKQANFHIVTVPTPVDEAKQPDLRALFKASESIGKILKKGDLVVYESTVYPGLTEEHCLPILETCSGLKSPADFKVGYSPERINPADDEHTFTRIRKVVSGQDAEALDAIAEVYASVVSAGIFKARSIKVAEAAKVIENTQRDLNIALMNELALIFGIMGLDTQAVLDAASTKWNFLRFTPGLVGGHCIGVDPYYLTHKAEKLGYHPEVILAGRRINDGMGRYVARMTLREMIRAGHNVQDSSVTVLGLTFKENCPDIRNTRVIDAIRELEDWGVQVQLHDPLADPHEVEDEYGMRLTPFEELKPSAAVVAAVSHDAIKGLSPDALKKLCLPPVPLVIDVKSMYSQGALEAAGIRVWRM
jgi:UDP-N-acetyl-D-galactosamine dehydrogenase